jgi:hypothetical protein
MGFSFVSGVEIVYHGFKIITENIFRIRDNNAGTSSVSGFGWGGSRFN